MPCLFTAIGNMGRGVCIKNNQGVGVWLKHNNHYKIHVNEPYTIVTPSISNSCYEIGNSSDRTPLPQVINLFFLMVALF